MTAKEILAIKCTSIDGVTQEIQTLALEETKRFILNYCNISCVPTEANFLWANMALDLINGSYLQNTADIDAIKPCEVTSMTAGDMSASRSSDTIAHKIDLDGLILNYREQLNKYRRLDWGMGCGQNWGL